MTPYYQIYGHGLPIVFVHGFCEDSSMWDHWRKNFSGCQVIRIDLPGFGQTEIDQEYQIKDMAEMVAAALDQAGIDRCIMIGHSMGGYVSLAFAERYPQRLIGLGLFHSHPYADTPETKEARIKRKQFVEKNGTSPYIRQVIPGLFAPERLETHEGIINRLIKRAEQFPVAGILNALQAMHDRPDRSAVLEKIEVPVLFIVGKKDQAIPLHYSMEQLELPAISAIHVDNDLGHMGMFESPEKCLQQIKAFIHLCRLYL